VPKRPSNRPASPKATDSFHRRTDQLVFDKRDWRRLDLESKSAAKESSDIRMYRILWPTAPYEVESLLAVFAEIL
jgi:hypothetical protein